VLTIIFAALFAILVQRAYWMLGLSLLVMGQSITIMIIAAIMYPTNWMTEETYKVEHQRCLGEITRIRGTSNMPGGVQEVLIAHP
jgi:hypothetical protein